MYLQYKPNTNEGDFCLNPLIDNNENFIFKFSPVSGKAETYHIAIKGKYIMSYSDSHWRLRLGNNTNINAEINVQMQEDCSFIMKGAWVDNKFFNFDTTTFNSYVYSDKEKGAIWQIEKVDKGSCVPLVSGVEIFVYPTLSKGIIHVSSPENSSINILDISGQILASYKSSGNNFINLNFPNGLYFVCVNIGDKHVYRKVVLQS